jgi:hypothetical protein
MKISDATITSFRLRPLQASQVKVLGWYLYLDIKQLGTSKWGCDGAWFYELTQEGWRTETGCLDCGPFEPEDLFIGPVDMTVFTGEKNA